MKLNLSEKKGFSQDYHIVIAHCCQICSICTRKNWKKSDNHTRSKYVANQTDTDTRLTRIPKTKQNKKNTSK